MKTTVKRSKFLIALVVPLTLSVVGTFYLLSFSGASEPVDNLIPIQHVYENKIVYTADQSVATRLLKADCARRSGSFNSCGTICPDSAEFCAGVCAFTCELDLGLNNNEEEDMEP